MLKKVLKGLSLVIIPVVILIISLLCYDKYLDIKIREIYNPVISEMYGVDEKNKGMCLLDINAEREDLLMVGSSELDSTFPQSASEMFPNTELESDVSIIGRAYVQSLLNIIRFGALADDFKDEKMVMLVSLQWFMGEETNKEGYQANFSEIQFYNMMNNENISEEVKMYVCKRTADLANNQSKLIIPATYATLYQQDNIFSKAALTFLRPYYFVREKFITLKDKHKAYNVLKKYKDEPRQQPIDINWQEEMLKAEENGKQACTNNEFYANDEYYNKYLKPNLEALKGSNSNMDLLSSKEYEDFEMLLKLCKETGIRPYFIFTPTNGKYYDYIGITQDKRQEYFEKVINLTEKYGFDYFNMQNQEYEPYVLKDVMHLGWKGWVTVNEKITDYFSQNKN